MTTVVSLAGWALAGVTVFVIVALTSGVYDSALGRAGLAAGVYAALGAPAVIGILWFMFRRMDRLYDAVEQGQHEVARERARRRLDAQIADALEMADDETKALRVIERAFRAIAPESTTELLLADDSQAHLAQRAAFTVADMPGCDVAAPKDCPAAKRARTHRFDDTDALDACPRLIDRADGHCAATCIPVSVMGRTVGVIHTIGSRGLSEDADTNLHAVANHAGSRLGMLRLMAETQLQAETDALTGLMNRRAFENGFRQIRSSGGRRTVVVAMADLDNFKAINDTHGHDTGDRALRAFAGTLRDSLREGDLVARHGGEEFAIVFPNCGIEQAERVLERTQTRLEEAIRGAGLPRFTVSAGITAGDSTEDLDVLLARADAALLQAKQQGRNRVVASASMDVDTDAQRELLEPTAKD